MILLCRAQCSHGVPFSQCPWPDLGSWPLVLCSLKSCWKKARDSGQACWACHKQPLSAGVGLWEPVSHHRNLLVSMATTGPEPASWPFRPSVTPVCPSAEVYSGRTGKCTPQG